MTPCPKCEGEVETVRVPMEGLVAHRAECGVCGLAGHTAMTAEFALNSFVREHGLPPRVSLAAIEALGGPSSKTMNYRVSHGMYPRARKRDRRWTLPVDEAEKVIDEWRRKERMTPLPEVADRCGLKRRSLNPLAQKGRIDALLVAGRWYVGAEEVERLVRHYREGVTTTEAARHLGLADRSSVHSRMRSGKLSYTRVGNRSRVFLDGV